MANLKLPPVPIARGVVDVGSAAFVRWLDMVKQRTDNLSLDGTIDARTIIEGTISISTLPPIYDAQIDPLAAIQWSKISKLGSSLADLVVRSAGDLSSGNLAFARMPTGTGTWAASPTIAGTLTAGGHVLPSLTDTWDLGSPSLLFRQGYLAQLNAVLFAKETQSLYGGWLAVSKNAGVFAAAVASAATSIDFGTAMVLNQFVLVRGIDAGGIPTSEFFKVGALVSGTRYTVTRNLSGLGAKNWPMGTAFQVRGVTGDGWIELNAYDTPRFSAFAQGSAYNNSSEQIRIGYLTGMPNSSSGIGFYMGDASSYLRWDGTALKLVSAQATIDANGITLTSSTDLSTPIPARMYRISSTGSRPLGMYGYDNGTEIGVGLIADANASRSRVLLSATYGGQPLRAADAAYLSLDSPASGSLGIASLRAGQITLTSTSISLINQCSVDLVGTTLSLAAGSATATLTPGTFAISAAMTLTGGLTAAGLLAINGLGTHVFSAGGAGSNRLDIINTLSGAGNTAQARVTAGTATALLFATSQGYTAGTYDQAAAAILQGIGAGGISLAFLHSPAGVKLLTEGFRIPRGNATAAAAWGARMERYASRTGISLRAPAMAGEAPPAPPGETAGR